MFAKMRAERLLSEIRSLDEAATAANRDLSTEERGRYNDLVQQTRQAVADAETDVEMRAVLAKFTPAGTEFRAVTPVSRAETRTTTAGKVEQRAILVPSMAEYREQATTPDADGGFTVPAQLWNETIDRLRPASVLLSANPSMFAMDSLTLSIPKIGVGASAAFVAESTEIPASTIEFDRVLLTAHKLAARVISSSEWLNDSAAGGGRLIIERNLMREIATTLDDKLFNGDGDVEPLGLLDAARTGIERTAFDGTLTLDDVAAAIGLGRGSERRALGDLHAPWHVGLLARRA